MIFPRRSHRNTNHMSSIQDTRGLRTAMPGHCQVVGDNIVTGQQMVLSGRDCHRHALEAACFVPVISAQLSNRCLISLRYSGADSRCRLGRKCWAMGPYADKNRWACPADLNPCMRCSRWRVGRCEFLHRLLRERLWRCSTPGRLSRFAAP
jgi:hypothetical protein